MNVKKAIKRIAAIGTGAAMLGATILGAVAAADLNQYPSPLFIGTDGKFNALLVVGKAASSEDIIGAIDIATALQAASVTTTTTGATTTVLEGGAKVETSGQKLYFGDYLNSTKTSLTSSELPVFLKDGKIVDEGGTEFTYKQIIRMPRTTITFGTTPDSLSDPVIYLDLPSAVNFSYELSFPTAVNTQYLRNKLITIMGKEYTLSGTTGTGTASGIGGTGGELNCTDTTNGLVLYGGGLDQTFSAGEAVTVTVGGKDIPVEVTGVNTGTTTATATIKVNGESASVTAGETVVLGGVRTYVRDIFAYTTPVTSGAARLFIGTDKLTLISDNEAKLASTNIGGTEIDMSCAATQGKTLLSTLKISFKPYNFDVDRRYMKLGDSITDPVFGLLKMSFTDVVPGLKDAARDVIKIYPSAEQKIKLEFTNKAGQAYALNILNLSTGAACGTALAVDSYGLINIPASAVNRVNLTCDDHSTSLERSGAVRENDYFIVDTNGYSHILQLKKISTNPNKIRVRDVSTSGETLEWSYNETGADRDGEMRYDGNVFTFTVETNATITGINVTGITNNLTTKSGARITLPFTNGNITSLSQANDTIIQVTEETTYNDGTYTSADGGTLGEWSTGSGPVNITIDYSSGAAQWDSIVGSPAGGGLSMQSVSNTYDSKGVTRYGTYAEYTSSSGSNKVNLYYPSAAASYNVYFGPATATTTTTGGTKTQTVNVWNVGTAKLDSEVADIKAQNAIIIGGPCANTAAAAIMGSPSPCGKDFTEGKAMVKLYENAGKVAMLVAGYNAEDTRRASRVASQWSKYASSMKGAEVTVTGTSLTDITVAAAQ